MNRRETMKTMMGMAAGGALVAGTAAAGNPSIPPSNGPTPRFTYGIMNALDLYKQVYLNAQWQGFDGTESHSRAIIAAGNFMSAYDSLNS